MEVDLTIWRKISFPVSFTNGSNESDIHLFSVVKNSYDLIEKKLTR